jgi:peroxiredoxin
VPAAECLFVALLGATAPACGGGSEETVGTSTVTPTHPVELDLRTTENVFITLGDMRGRIVVLFIFATFDDISLAELRPLSAFVRYHPEVDVVGIAVQPGADQFAAAWEATLDPPFLVTFDPEERIALGTTDLGALDAVPTIIVLDAEGMIRARHVGFASRNDIEEMVADAAPRPE